jgi:hypothetical protein
MDFLGRLVQQNGCLYFADAVVDEEVDDTGQRRCRKVEALVADFAIISGVVLE